MSSKVLKYIYIDCETTGKDSDTAGLIQISVLFDIGKETKDSFYSQIKPLEGCVIEEEALEVNHLTREQIDQFPPSAEVFSQFKKKLNNFIDPFDREDKAFFVGYNSKFDTDFVRKWFLDNSDKFYGSYFYAGSIDVMVLYLEYLKNCRHQMPNFKLLTVAKAMDIVVDENAAHDAHYDNQLTRQLYHLIT